MDDDSKKQKINLNLELSDEIAQGIYSNLALVGHSATEFIIDFTQILPGIKKAKVRSRIILTPEHAKNFLKVLLDSIQKHEEHFGKIQVRDDKKEQMIMMGFGKNSGEA